MAETSRSEALMLDTGTARGVPLRNYDVFLNHRGPDVKRGFVDHLAAAMEAKGVEPFVDHKDLLRGEDTWDDIQSAIRHSKVHVAVFSPGYASSAWCLKELHEILECRRNGWSQGFLPVFFNVQPSDLRYLSSPKSCYAEAFAKHRKREQNHPDDVRKWEKALHEASMVTGLTLDSEQGFEARLMKLIVSEVLDKLDPTLLDIAKYPVAVDEKLEEALSHMKILGVQQGLSKFGIYGMGGIGKTTLAKSIYNKIHRDFDGFCFIESVSSKAKPPYSLERVQEWILSGLLKNRFENEVCSISQGKQLLRKRCSGLKILLILDDVDDLAQLEALLTPLEFCHLKDGSRVVITTRDEQIVIWAKVQQKLCIEGLGEAHAQLLFSWHAFLQPEEPQELKELAKKVVAACGGLPLALEILGAHLYDKDLVTWEATVNGLEEVSGKLPPASSQVTKRLRISYDGLGDTEKSMFLDVACFMLGVREDLARRAWGKSGAAKLCFDTLRLKSLVKVDKDRRLTMHDLLRDMGREIVVAGHQKVWERSHLWDETDVQRVLQKGKQGASELRALRLVLDRIKCDTSSFAGMDSLKFLLLWGGTEIKGDLGLLPKELTWFQWVRCPLQSLPPELDLSKVAVLDLGGSDIASLPKDCKFEDLQELRLYGCPQFRELPDFGDCCQNLEVLDLEDCKSLESVPKSIGCLSSTVTHLNLKGCRRITALPDVIGQLTKLEEIGIDNLGSLVLLPQSLGKLTKLSSLSLRSSSSLQEIPSTIGNLRKLSSLVMTGSRIREIPDAVTSLTNLVQLQVYDCRSMVGLPEAIGNLRMLGLLRLSGNQQLSHLPSSIGQLEKLETLALDGCNIGAGLPQELCNLQSLMHLDLGGNPFTGLPEGLHSLSKLRTLHLRRCWNLREVPPLPSSLETLDTSGCSDLREVCLTSPSLKVWVTQSCPALTRLPSGLPLSLEELGAGGCRGLDTPEVHSQLARLTSLRHLDLGRTGVSPGPWIEELVSLDTVVLDGEILPGRCLPDSSWSTRITVPRKADDMECKGIVLCVAFSSSLLSVKMITLDHRTGKELDECSIRALRKSWLSEHGSLLLQIYRTTAHPFLARLEWGDILLFRLSSSRDSSNPVVAVRLVWQDHEFKEILTELARTDGQSGRLLEPRELVARLRMRIMKLDLSLGMGSAMGLD